MQRDFHYYAIRVLMDYSRWFRSEEAEIVAYSSQFVDDAMDYGCINLGGYTIDLIRTAHMGLESFQWNTQRDVFVPFHFIPSEYGVRQNFKVKPNCTLARELVELALHDNDFYALGIALHSYADTFSHEDFSGIWESSNTVDQIQIKKGEKWETQGVTELVLDALPEIGHTEAGFLPDLPYLCWRFRRGDTWYQHTNPSGFLAAAKFIFSMVNRGDQMPSYLIYDFEDLLGLETSLVERERAWREQFKSIFDQQMPYNVYSWKNTRMEPTVLESHWTRFNKAARRQRNYILERMFG